MESSQETAMNFKKTFVEIYASGSSREREGYWSRLGKLALIVLAIALVSGIVLGDLRDSLAFAAVFLLFNALVIDPLVTRSDRKISKEDR